MSEVKTPSSREALAETRSLEWLTGAYNACAILCSAPAIRGSALELVHDQAYRYLQRMEKAYAGELPEFDDTKVKGYVEWKQYHE